MKVLAPILASLLLCLGLPAQDHASHLQTNPVTLVPPTPHARVL